MVKYEIEEGGIMSSIIGKQPTIMHVSYTVPNFQFIMKTELSYANITVNVLDIVVNIFNNIPNVKANLKYDNGQKITVSFCIDALV